VSPNGHEDGGLNHAMRSGETSAAGLGIGVGREKLEHALTELD